MSPDGERERAAHVDAGDDETSASAIARETLLWAARVLLARGRIDQVVEFAEELDDARVLLRVRASSPGAPCLVVVSFGHSFTRSSGRAVSYEAVTPRKIGCLNG